MAGYDVLSSQLFKNWKARYQNDISYHGSFRRDALTRSPIIHAGTLGQAAARLHFVSSTLKHSPLQRLNYYSDETYEDMPDWDEDEDEEPQTHVGLVHAVRHTGGVMPRYATDEEVNTAHYIHLRRQGYEDFEIPRSITDTMSQNYRSKWGDYRGPKREFGALKALRQGKAVRYRNEGEYGSLFDPQDKSDISIAIPRKAISTFDRDVGRTSSHPQIRRLATRRMAAGTEGAVRFPAREDWDNPTRPKPAIRIVNALQFQTGPEED